jgi:hypothetical protein
MTDRHNKPIWVEAPAEEAPVARSRSYTLLRGNEAAGPDTLRTYTRPQVLARTLGSREADAPDPQPWPDAPMPTQAPAGMMGPPQPKGMTGPPAPQSTPASQPGPQVLTQALAPRGAAQGVSNAPAAPPGYANPGQALVDSAQARANAPAAPTFTADEIAQRRDANAQAQRWGILGLMMGDEGQQRAGAAVLQQALGASQQRVTDKGVFDPITGKMSVNSQYAQERGEDKLDKAQEQAAQYAYGHGNLMDSQRFQQMQQDRQFGQQRALAAEQFGYHGALEQMRANAQRAVAAGQQGMPSAEVMRSQIAASTAMNLLQDYRKALDNYDPRSFDQLSPTQKATVGQKASTLLLQLKEAYALGAISETDMGLMQGQLADPFGANALRLGRDGLQTQVDQTLNSLNARQQVVNQIYPSMAARLGAPAGAAPNAAPLRIERDGG